LRFALIQGKLVPETLSKTPESKFLPISLLPTQPSQPINPKFSFNADLQKMTIGKQLLFDDLPFKLDDIHSHYVNGYITYRKGIEFERQKPRCVRCGNQDLTWFSEFPCSRCLQTCTYCRRCLMMGRVSTCTPLISWSGPIPSFPPTPASLLVWTGVLSPGQQSAATIVKESVLSQKELLVWAVCGAGKTEILFAGIEQALQQNLRVCIATPRTDVVLELTPRLQTAFPTITIASLYGGSPDRHLYAPLTIATTHQLLRFYHAFDIVILDEVDAFPYSVDKTLKYAVKQARKLESALIYLTATPNQKWQKECLKGKRPFVTIPARFHRHPLPVPEFVWCGNWEKQLKRKQLPPNVSRWITERIQNKKQVLLFLPKIKLIETVLPILRTYHSAIESVHAQDPKRKEKVMDMRNGLVPLLITTTILERGVTLPNIDVAVLGAEDQIFTESALVQIAGRVGRSAQFPTGTITFFHYGKSKAMVKARNQILKMNMEALQKGLVD
jgi:competence protein ComFA